MSARTDRRTTTWRDWLPVVVAALLLLGAVFYYGDRLMNWQAYDDEGGYLYAAWRISMGEMPYRDFLTPQLPAFLYPGSWVMSLFGMEMAVARWYAMALTLGACVWLWLATRRLYGPWPATLALGLALVEQEIYWAARFFRPEAPMLFFGMLGLYLFILGRDKARWGWLAAAGAAFGLAMMSKLFGALFVAGVGLWLLLEGLRSRDFRRMFNDGLIVAGGFIVVVGGMALAVSTQTDEFVACVLEHHTAQGAGMALGEMLRKTLAVYYDFCRTRPFYAGLAALGLVASLCDDKRLRSLFALQIPTVLAFFVMTRGLASRHFTYLVPSMAALAAFCVARLWQKLAKPGSVTRNTMAVVALVALVGLAAYPHVQRNAFVATWGEADTPGWVTYIQEHVGPDETLISDYPGLNFASKRSSGRMAAGISRGAAQTGQIKGSDLVGEIEQSWAPMVLLNVGQGAHQFANLVDYDAFKAYLQTQFYLSERRRYDYRLMEVYTRTDLWPGDALYADFGHQVAMTGVTWDPVVGEDGHRQVGVALRWNAVSYMPADYSASLRLVDADGHEWGLGSKRMADVDLGTWWDDEGHEQATMYPTTQWAPTEATIQHYELPVDPGAPAGEYNVLLRVHPEGQWNGLTAFGVDGTPVGYDVSLGVIDIPAPTRAGLREYEMDEVLQAEMAPGISLIGRRAIIDTAFPGDAIALRMLWEWDATFAVDADLVVVLESSAGSIEQRMPLLSESWKDEPRPASTMTRTSVEAYGVDLPRDMAPGDYAMRIAVTEGSKTGEWLDLATITVPEYERSFDAPAGVAAHGVIYGEGLTLVAAEATAAADRIQVDLVWQCDVLTDTRYTVFCQAFGTDGGMLAQADVIPGDGLAPTTSWVEGQVVHDAIALALPQGTSAEDATVVVGLYDPLTGLRLPVRDGACQSIGDHVTLEVSSD